MRRLQQRLHAHGITLDVLALDVEALWWSLLRDDPAATAQLDTIEHNIRVAGDTGVPCLKYRIQPLGVLRTGNTSGRGGARYHAFDVDRWTDTSRVAQPAACTRTSRSGWPLPRPRRAPPILHAALSIGLVLTRAVRPRLAGVPRAARNRRQALGHRHSGSG